MLVNKTARVLSTNEKLDIMNEFRKNLYAERDIIAAITVVVEKEHALGALKGSPGGVRQGLISVLREIAKNTPPEIFESLIKDIITHL